MASPPTPLRQRPRARLRLPGDTPSAPLARRPRLMHPYGMDERGWIGRHGFWPLALLWLPAGIAAGRLGPWLAMMAMETWSLAPFVPCGLPLALGCRRLWRLGYRRGAWIAGVALGAATVAATLPAGLLGPLAIAVCAVALGLPIWLVWWWLVWKA